MYPISLTDMTLAYQYQIGIEVKGLFSATVITILSIRLSVSLSVCLRACYTADPPYMVQCTCIVVYYTTE